MQRVMAAQRDLQIGLTCVEYLITKVVGQVRAGGGDGFGQSSGGVEPRWEWIRGVGKRAALDRADLEMRLLDSYEYLWIPMDSYGFLWIPIGFL